jgi:hypothetical protein
MVEVVRVIKEVVGVGGEGEEKVVDEEVVETGGVEIKTEHV